MAAAPVQKGVSDVKLLQALPVVLLAALLVPQPGTASDTGDAEIVHLEHIWNQAQLRGDAETLDQLTSDSLLLTIPGMRVLTKAESLSVVRSGRMKFDRYETSDVYIQMFGDAAVVTGRLQRTRIVEGASVDDDWRFTKVYLKREGKWLIVSFHASNR
jgi:hypothetical protein